MSAHLHSNSYSQPAPAHHKLHAISSRTAERMQRLPSQPRNVPGEPYLFPAGYFAGKYVQATLEEVQKGDRARKMAGEGGKDARQVDPPPVARLCLRERRRDGSYTDVPAEAAVSNVQLVCSIELYPYNIEYDEACPGIGADVYGGSSTEASPQPSPIQPAGCMRIDPRLAVERQYPPNSLPSRPRRPLGPHAALATQPEGSGASATRVHTVFGARTVTAQLCRHVGAIYFIFDDLKIRRTGHFVLKYSVFLIDPTLICSGAPMPCIAEAWGGVFAVYPSRTAPPLRESTELTKHLNACGLLARARRRPRQRPHKGGHEDDMDEHDDDDEPATPASTHSSASSASPASSSSMRSSRYDPVRDL